jgi:hypothetical protein
MKTVERNGLTDKKLEPGGGEGHKRPRVHFWSNIIENRRQGLKS